LHHIFSKSPPGFKTDRSKDFIPSNIMLEGQSIDNNRYIDFPPQLITDTQHQNVLHELIQREPIFHHPEFGTTRQDFEDMTDEAFWEVGASGRRYSREHVLTDVTKRYENPEYHGIKAPPEDTWETQDFYCQKIATHTYLLTYTLFQGERVTRRSTIWQRSNNNWKILYHQGTVVEKE
jgi:hypothetical protein